ncbi:hypothetical protein C1862_05370 [Eggerthella lenta]|uniref:Uncharacterized protein n=1 Tax=Eggerthella lenta (strain ATCC 25559 / DSM 2243 / CCUG 17323 / JCM 9979 / KCTC 3265 / NCTC 11813 / VPI 0255 / 1899 B) TaxID=479437 RepID=C8WLV9_EGGLE|nr:hypothetical protein [Eggerthella lenta]ACV56572.1 hypothetical protein Elen_2621 [Eggerthella lenta DSM 2243]RDB85168.1 hypothetical protein C1870_05700 [Eggerthella lenta]RDB87773.1 hypothetical protein C1869_10175 [Eggerthella lenta]RDC10831.1 hypothetical protein C1862_05370 [Eggerthella lenta]
MSDSLEDTVRRVSQASKCSSVDIAAFAGELARIGETAKEAFERMAESLAEIRRIADEQTKPEVFVVDGTPVQHAPRVPPKHVCGEHTDPEVLA